MQSPSVATDITDRPKPEIPSQITPFTNIVLRSNIYSRVLLSDMAMMLKQRHGSKIHVFCAIPEDLRHYHELNVDGRFDTVSVETVMHFAAIGSRPDEDATIAAAQKWEDRLGAPLNRIIMTNRHLGRGYSLGGYHHPRSQYSEDASYLQVLSGVCETLDFWEREFRKKNVSLVMHPNKEAAVIALLMGIPIRHLTTARYQNYYYWGHDEYLTNPGFAEAFKHAKPRQEVDLTQPYLHAQVEQSKAFRNMLLLPTLRRMSRITAQTFYGRLKGYKKSRGYYLLENLRSVLRIYQAGRRFSRFAYTRSSELSSPFVYFPLQEEPETVLTIGSPEYLSQLSAITSLSRDMPAGTLLAVKETPYALGRRPDNFYGQISEFKNVRWLDIMEPGIEVIRIASAVATIAGTSGLEAALMGKPVISFGRHNFYDFIPHVHVVRSEEELAPSLAAALDRTNNENPARGAQALKALLDCSFELTGYSRTTSGQHHPDAVENAYRQLVREFDPA